MTHYITPCQMDAFCVLPAGHTGQHSTTGLDAHKRRRAERMKDPEFREAYEG